MGRPIHKLKPKECDKATLKVGRHSDGGGLYLKVAQRDGEKGGSKSWTFMWNVNGKRREVGLGSYPAVGLREARDVAMEYRKSVAAGLDPTANRKKEAEKTFGDVIDRYIKEHQGGWKNDVHKRQWKRSAEVECAEIRDLPISKIDQDAVLSVLNPLWSTVAETAARCRGRIDLTMEFAIAHKWHSGPNPAAWRTLRAILPKPKRIVKHHAALPFAEIPTLYKKLADTPGSVSARALQFLILTAARSGEVRGAVWSEFDLDGALWSIPGERMKAGKMHQVPLSSACVEILQEMRGGIDPDPASYVFPGAKSGQPLSVMAFDMQLRRLEYSHITSHGFRSGFRDWCGDVADAPREIAEAALAHTLGKVERSYRRGSALEKRRELMSAWAEFVTEK